jgi:hypothetical protein
MDEGVDRLFILFQKLSYCQLFILILKVGCIVQILLEDYSFYSVYCVCSVFKDAKSMAQKQRRKAHGAER